MDGFLVASVGESSKDEAEVMEEREEERAGGTPWSSATCHTMM